MHSSSVLGRKLRKYLTSTFSLACSWHLIRFPIVLLQFFLHFWYSFYWESQLSGFCGRWYSTTWNFFLKNGFSDIFLGQRDCSHKLMANDTYFYPLVSITTTIYPQLWNMAVAPRGQPINRESQKQWKQLLQYNSEFILRWW